MPLHAVSRFSKALPEGDRGGNSVTIPRLGDNSGRQGNLHGYWDALISQDTSREAVEELADELVKEHPRDAFKDELTLTNIAERAAESATICIKTVYRDLDPEITTFADVPVGYEADGRRVARRRGALAGSGWRASLRGYSRRTEAAAQKHRRPAALHDAPAVWKERGGARDFAATAVLLSSLFSACPRSHRRFLDRHSFERELANRLLATPLNICHHALKVQGGFLDSHATRSHRLHARDDFAV
jgi:hypothetical protein